MATEKTSARKATPRANKSGVAKSSANVVVPAVDPAELPLFTLLSFVYVAFTIEFDNEAERRMAHSTTAGRGSGLRGPWLTSLVMYETA